MPLHIRRSALEDELLEELGRKPFLVLTGPRGSGKTTLLRRLAERWRGPTAIVQLEPIACSPEVLRDEMLRLADPVLTTASRGAPPLEVLHAALVERPRDGLLLLDDVTELRTLTYYRDVERPLEGFLEALSRGPGPTIATTRFGFWARREFPELTFHALPPLSAEELRAAGAVDAERLVAATGGLVVHASRLAEGDVADALVEELRPGGGTEAECRATMADLLHRARGYGACKWVLRVLAAEEGLSLTEVSRRLERTPGSTRDYLKWLEEVDLIVSRGKRFYYVDPVLRLWVRIYGRGVPPTDEAIRNEVEAHVGARDAEPIDEPFTFPPPPSEDLVEID